MSGLPAELVAAIHAAPDEPAAYLVAADWLQQRGDPHGELIALSLAEPDRDVALLVDELQEAVDPLRALERRRWPHDWRWGFLRRVVVSAETPAIMRQLLGAPTAQCLRELVVTGDRASILGAVEAILDHAPGLRALRSLELPRGSIYPAVQPHWPELPELERLAIGAAQLPVESALPKLRELDVDLGSRDPAVWLDRTPLTGVERLILRSQGPLHEPARFLAPVPDLRRLTIVGHFGTIDERGLETLAALVDDVDAITFDLANTESFRRFATRQRYAPGEAALLAVGGTDPVEPGTLSQLGTGPRFMVGRTMLADLQLGPTCTRRHATLAHQAAGERWMLEDGGSAALTAVCGTPIGRVALCDGDELTFGNHVFRFLEHDVAAKAAALCRQLALPARNAKLHMSR